jgi:hypothetical protein
VISIAICSGPGGATPSDRRRARAIRRDVGVDDLRRTDDALTGDDARVDLHHELT